MEMEKIQYSGLEYIGIDKNKPQRTLLFRRSLYRPRESSILFGRDAIEISESQFRDDMKGLQRRISEIEGSWEYRNLINFDTSELDELRSEYNEIQRLNKEIKDKSGFEVK